MSLSWRHKTFSLIINSSTVLVCHRGNWFHSGLWQRPQIQFKMVAHVCDRRRRRGAGVYYTLHPVSQKFPQRSVRNHSQRESAAAFVKTCFHCAIPGQLDVFLSTFMPGHGPSRRNYQDQDQDQGQRKTLPVFVHINGYLKSVSQPRQPTRSQRRAFTRFHSPFNNSKKLHSGGARPSTNGRSLHGCKKSYGNRCGYLPFFFFFFF